MRLNILLLLLFFSFAIKAQQFHFRNYSLSEGLAQSQIFAILETRDGTIWMGTRGGGLSAFDGIRFTNYTTKEGLIDNYVLSLAEDASGKLWIGTNNGLCTWNGRKFEAIALPEPGTLVVESIITGKEGELFVATQKGLFYQKNGRFLKDNSAGTEENNSCLYYDTHGKLWIGGNKGVTAIGKNIRHFGLKEGLTGLAVRAITEDAGHTIWVGTYGNGISWINAKGIQNITAKNVLPDLIIQCLYRDSQNRIWIGTQEAGAGYWSPTDSLFRFLNERDGLCNNNVHCITEDHWGNIWFGTSGGGVSKYYGQQFTHFDQRSGLPGRNVYAMAEDSSGAIWFSTSAGGLCRLEGNTVKDFSRTDEFPAVKIKKLLIDWKNRLWIGTEGEGVFLYDGITFNHFGNENGLKGNWIRDILQDFAGNFWIAKAGGGIARISENETGFSIKNFNVEEGLPEDRINSLVQGKDGRIWFATTSNGVGFIQNDSIRNFSTTDGLPGKKLRSLALAPDGKIWIGMVDKGICSMDFKDQKPVFKTISTADGLASDNIYLLSFDKDGRLWSGSEKGLDRLSFNSNGVLEEIKHFGYSEGFTGIETSQNAVLSDKKGNLWFGTINGLTRFNPSLTEINKKAPLLQLRAISLFFKPISETNYSGFWDHLFEKPDTLELPYDQNHLSFDFFGVNQRNPEQVKYQWKLAGLDQSWTPAGFQHNVTYSNLPPGDYTFFYRAANEDNVWSKEQAIHFSIEPPLWKRWWFIAACGVLIIFLIWLYLRWRVRRIKRKSREAQEKLKLETEVLKLEQKALQLQMNPHFIFNALNSIQSLIGTQDEKTARFYLSKFSSLMRKILESSREQVIPLEMEISILENYLSIEQFSHGIHFTWEITTDDQIDKAVTGILPMLIHPFVENAVIHGVTAKGVDGKIQVHFSKADSQLIVSVKDNGIGRKKAMERKSQQDQHHKSTALLVVQERLELLDGNTHIEIIDLEDLNGNAEGTEIRLSLPWIEF